PRSRRRRVSTTTKTRMSTTTRSDWTTTTADLFRSNGARVRATSARPGPGPTPHTPSSKPDPAMAAQSKAQFLNDVLNLLKKRYKLEPSPGRMSVLEATVYGICHEGATREQANQALSRFKDDFFDWNEVRVSSLEEIQGVLAGLPDPEGRAMRLRRFLRQL